MADVTLEQVVAIAGNYNYKSGGNYLFRCPICFSEGHDAKGDNLIYNFDKKVVKCFANEGHSLDVLALINEQCPSKRDYVEQEKPKVVPVWEQRQEKYVEYMCLAQEKLLNNKELLMYLYKKRGLKKLILDLCGIGFDDTENCFTIPIFSLAHNCITDFELRKKSEEKHIRRIGGGCSTIAKIWGVEKAKELYIVEGFIDGITLAQWLLESKKDSFTIYSCSNGVGSLFNCLKEVDFSNFSTVKLILDNDDAGNLATKQIIDKYKFITDCRQFLVDSGCKDINEYYLRKVVKNV